MASDLNCVTLSGRLTREPEMRSTPSGSHQWLDFGLASNQAKKVGNEWEDEPCFVDVTVFGDQGKRLSERLRKGQYVIVVGRLVFRQWEDREGNKRSKLSVNAQQVITPPQPDNQQPARSPSRQAEYAGYGDDDPPF